MADRRGCSVQSRWHAVGNNLRCSQQGIHRSCAGFLVEWDQIYEDPQRRPGKVLFGYLCAAEDRALENEQIRKLVSEIGIRPQGDLPDAHKVLSDVNADSHRPAAIETAR